ncbi:MAG: sigma-54-dependent Fis family transcriptional regulator [Planctomycetes bacterium]|nr:sigma-54-dependent Fis family transcriptional regulator [Planctomycetota bacterium]
MKILLSDDEKSIAVTLSDELKSAGHEVVTSADGNKSWDLIQKTNFDCILLDIKMPGLDGLELLNRVKKIQPDLPVIIITGYGTVESAVGAMKLGAVDYVQKPFLNEEIVLILEKIQKFQTLQKDYNRLKEQVEERTEFGNLIGKSKKMQAVYELVESVSKTEAGILIQGESGTGKELIAEAIHYNSFRKEEPLIKMSCSVFPETLIESELFGHEKGAFTDAKGQKIGRFEMANHGTIFIDDIDDMSLTSQVKLLRVLQEKEFERLGGTETIKVDIRIIAATNRDHLSRVKENKFREDLYYRLNVVTIKLPPLREREGDILMLLQHFVQKHSKERDREYIVDPETLISLDNYPWPGNVRELENAVERAIALAGPSNVLKKEHLLKQSAQQVARESEEKNLLTLSEMLEQTERAYIKKILDLCQGNKGEVIKILTISRKSLWEKLKKYDLEE